MKFPKLLYVFVVMQFEDVFNTQPDSKENLSKIVDPRLGNDYSIDSVYKVICHYLVNENCKSVSYLL